MHKFNENIDVEFEKVLLFFNQGLFILDNSFKQALFQFFDAHPVAANDWVLHYHLFENFGFLWHKIESDKLILMPKEHTEKVFDKILSYVYEWETANVPNKIHKGTIYYFMVSYVF